MGTKCAAFWHHTNVRSDNKIFPCCRYKTPIGEFTGNLKEILFLDTYKDLRAKSLSDEKILGCEKCYYEESIGKKSLRQQFNDAYDTDAVELNFLEIGFDNICNLTCDGCWHEFSSAWGNKIMLLKSEVVKSTVDITDIPSTITKALFLGGEPLMTARHKKFLSLFSDLSNLTVIYNTNGTFLLDDQTITLLKKCKSAEFIVSIDGVGSLNDTVRSGSRWSDILCFLKQLRDLNFGFTVHTTIHLNNWMGLEDLSRFIEEHDYKWTTNLLTYPKHLDINNSEVKYQIKEFIEKINIPNKEVIINHLTK
jgi:sulfatase maturation enzyme AslB (radical SAM superfamily)